MRHLRYLFYKLLSKFSPRGNAVLINYYRSLGMKIGDNTHVFSEIVTSEPYLITIGEDCTIATNVSLLTHDASVGVIVGRNIASDLCGEITIGNKCFIGNGAIIMYGVSLANKTIVAAGSVVTKSVNESGCIIGGNPAKIIGKVDVFLEKHNKEFMNLYGLGKKKRQETILNNASNLCKR